MKSKLKWNELRDVGFVRKVIANTIPTSRYYVTKPADVDWPEDVELICFCDGGAGMNFGGTVRIVGSSAYVDVYVD